MLGKLKSKFFLRILFSSLDERTKLKLVQYNKGLQKETNINIINYKTLNGRYIVYETNEVGAEYNVNDDRIVFAGEYLNGKRNGRGKEYDSSGKLIFESEYLNGKKNVKGKEYIDDNNVIFDGEYLNGKK